MTYFLTLKDLTELGIAMMAEEGEEFLIADAGLLDSASMRPQASAFGEPAYPQCRVVKVPVWGSRTVVGVSGSVLVVVVDGQSGDAQAAAGFAGWVFVPAG